MNAHREDTAARVVHVTSGSVRLEGVLESPLDACGTVLFAHGSGSSRHSPRNRFVAEALHRAGIATLLVDLLTPVEDQDYAMRFDIALLTGRLADALRWFIAESTRRHLPIGLFGASTGAAAALNLAAAVPERIAAVVSRGGRPDLADARSLAGVKAPTLLIVGGRDQDVLALNRAAYALMRCEKMLEIVPGATHLFLEDGTLDAVAGLAQAWFAKHFSAAGEAAYTQA